MAILYGTPNPRLKQAAGVGWNGSAKVAVASYEFADSVSLGSYIYMCKLPKGAVITGGRVTGDPIDSSGSGSALMSIHVGVDKAVTGLGTGTAITANSTSNCLISSLAIGPDAVAVTGYKATNTRNFPFGSLLVTEGPLLTSDDCNVVIAVTASTLALTTGTMNVIVEYYMSTHT